MNESKSKQALDPCGCCETGREPSIIYNPPGLPALSYRIDAHPSFLRRMLDRLRGQTIPPDDPNGDRPLSDLTTRDSTDPAIALLDAWATVADVLTFYQERIANEGYLRTATERRSVLELARAIGYELNPGVAASTYLAYTVEDAPGSPETAIVEAGARVQSVPGPGELPQTFETGAGITARVAWNALKPRLTRPQELALHVHEIDDKIETKLYLLGLSIPFADDASGVVSLPVEELYPLYVGDEEEVGPLPLPGSGEVSGIPVEHIYLKGTSTELQAGSLFLLVGRRAGSDEVKTLVRSVKTVETDDKLQRTRIDFEAEVVAEPPPVYQWVALQYAVVTLSPLTLNQTYVAQQVVNQTWRESDMSAFLGIQGWSGSQMVAHINRPPTVSVTPPSRLPPTDPGAFAMRERLGIFGHNAPHYDTLPKKAGGSDPTDVYGQNWDDIWDGTEGWQIWKDPLLTAPNDYWSDADIYLERSLPKLSGNTWIVLERPTNNYQAYLVESNAEASLARFALSGKASGLKLATDAGEALTDKPSAFKVRGTTVHAVSERLELAVLPIETAIEAGASSLQLDSMVLGLQIDQPVAITGERADLPGVMASEIAILSDIIHARGLTTLFFKHPLAYGYVRDTVSINANVVPATHGETVREVLGSGNGAQANQQFTLKKPPLTYVSASTPSGGVSTLAVRVNDIAWSEAASLYGLGSGDERFIVRLDDDGKVQITFGDGVQGARLPTGIENVTAIYRSGIGLGGMVDAGKLTLLQSRPLGIREVTNPVAAAGAADPESRDEARTNAPLTVLTLDRIVSLQDYEDFARGFSGVGKTRATAFWLGERHLVYITIAASAGSGGDGGTSALATHIVDETSDLYENLVSAIEQARDPAQEFLVGSYQPLFFNVRAKVLVDERYIKDKVFSEITEALVEAFSFEKRDFGQAVTSAEIVSLMQAVAGVVAVDLDQLYQYEDGEPPPDPTEQITPPLLPAKPVQIKETDAGLAITPAELLLINPVGVTLEAMKS